MEKYNNYKKYYQTKTVKLTPIDYQTMWLELLSYTKHNYPFWCLIMEKFENERLEKKKEMLKDE